MKVLAIGAHPDDIEISCGGTLARCIRRGDEVIMAHVCNGDKGHMSIPPEELAGIRANEAQESANVIGATVIHGSTGDGEIEEALKFRDIIVDIIRMANPHIIITHTPVDYHADHRIVSNLTVDASFMATVSHIKTGVDAIEKVPQIYFMEPYLGINFQPLEYVDITDTLGTKLEMMKKHTSQLEWLGDHDNMNTLDYIETMAKFRGLQCSVRYAEGFIRYNSALRATPVRHLP